MYIPNPEKWVQYYQSVANGNVNPYTDRMLKKTQTGGSLNRDDFMIPIGNQKNGSSQSRSDVQLKLVSPAQQVVDQAKEEMKHPLKRKAMSNKVIDAKRRRRNKTLQTKKRKNKKPNKKSLKKKKTLKTKASKKKRGKGKKKSLKQKKQPRKRITFKSVQNKTSDIFS